MKRRVKFSVLNFIMISGMVILLALLYMLLCNEGVKKSITVEAGIEVTPSIFLKDTNAVAEYSLESPAFYPDRPGDYIVQIKKGLFKYNCALKVVDTIAPIATAFSGNKPYGVPVTPYDFVSDIQDATEVQASFLEEPDMYTMGDQQVCVRLVDQAGNETRVNSFFKVVPIESDVVLEAGCEPITPDSLVHHGVYEASTLDFKTIEYNHVGEYLTYLIVDGYTYTCNISIVDTIAPQFLDNEIHTVVGIDREPDFFSYIVEDSTDLICGMSVTPDYSQVGETYLTYTVADEAGNISSRNICVYVEEDTEAPVFENAEDFKVFRDENVAYRKYVSVTDNSRSEVDLSVDSSQVDVSVVGEYPVIYTATDCKGNVSTKELTVSVVDRTYTDEDLYALIDKLLAQIITDDMDETERARAVYDWVKNNIEYTGKSDKNNFNKAAINGLLDFKGDCFTNTAICVACFKRMDMKAKVIKKDPIVTLFNHWWLIVKIDGDYYHMDTCPRTKDNPEMFLWTDYELKVYSAQHLETHNYDRSLYPHVKYRRD